MDEKDQTNIVNVRTHRGGVENHQQPPVAPPPRSSKQSLLRLSKTSMR